MTETVFQGAQVESAQPVVFGALLREAFSFPALLGALLVGAVFAAGRAFYVDPDLWWHIKVGQSVLATHRVPTADPYSFTVSGTPWMAYEWLGDVLLAAVQRAAGLQGMVALGAAIGAAIVLALYAYCTLRCGNSKAAFVAIAVLLILAEVSFTMRPQMLGYLFLVLTLTALELFRQGKPRVLWLLPPLFLLWVNTHGSFIIGLGTVGLYWASGLVEFRAGSLEAHRWTPAQRRRLEFVFALCLVALTITPYGTRLAAYPFDMALSQPLNVANIQEWQSMPFNMFFGKFFLVLLLAFLAAQIALRPSWRLEEFALFLLGTFMACMHARFVLIFVPFFAPLFATLLARWVPRYDCAKDRYALNAVLMAFIFAGLVAFFPSRARLEQSVAEHSPVEALDHLSLHPIPGPMYNQYVFGGYLVWALAPAQKVFIDGRGDIYERAGVMADYLRISRVDAGALALLDSYGIKSCLLLPDEPLATLLGASSDWQQVYADKVAVLFTRKGSSRREKHLKEQPADARTR